MELCWYENLWRQRTRKSKIHPLMYDIFRRLEINHLCISVFLFSQRRVCESFELFTIIKYKCLYCDKKFRIKKGLRTHLTIHTRTEIDKYCCSFCDKTCHKSPEIYSDEEEQLKKNNCKLVN